MYVLLAAVLVLGLVIGYGAAWRFGTTEAGVVRNARLQVGDVAPDFRLPDHSGGYVRLAEFQGDKNVVIAFFPLAWTPV
jgi:peroxiredoxin